MSRVLIAGAGLFGVTAALELRRRGHDVALLDPGRVPRPEAASTDVSKIVRLDYGADEPSMELMERALEGWRAWNRRWAARGLEPLFHEDGLLVMTRAPMAPGGFEHDSYHLLRQRSHRPARIDRAALTASHPGWNPALWADGYFNPEGGWAESGAVVARLAAEAREAGVELHEGRAFARLLEEGGRVAGLATERPSDSPDRSPRLLVHRADHVLVTAGAWTPVLLPWLAPDLRVVGQPVLLFRPAQPERWRAPQFPPFTADVARTGFYGFPALPDGTLKIARHGAGRRVHPDAPRAVDPGEEAAFRAFLAEAFPGLADAPLVGTRLCLYCDTADGHFWIDHDPQRPGLVVATGDSGHAFKFAPVLGALIADVLERRDDPTTRAWRRRCAWRAAGADRASSAGDAARALTPEPPVSR